MLLDEKHVCVYVLQSCIIQNVVIVLIYMCLAGIIIILYIMYNVGF